MELEGTRGYGKTIERSDNRLRLLWLIFVFFGILSGILQGQSWNRAVFRGDEIDPRDYEYNDEYFLNVLSYQLPPFWRETWNQGKRGYRLTIGSVRSDEFYLQQELKVHLDLTEELEFQFDLIEDEDFDTRYRRNRAGLIYAFHEKWKSYAFVEGTALKEDNDLMFGAIFEPADGHWWELQYTGVDFNERKGKEDREFTEDARGVLLRNEIPIFGGLSWETLIQLQLPMELVDPGEDLDLRFRKRLYEGGLRWRLASGETLRFFVSGEDSGKTKDDQAAFMPSDQDLDRQALRAGSECWWRGSYPFGADYHVGCSFFHFDERSVFPDDRAENEKHERDEFTVYGGLAFPVTELFWVRPALYIDYVRQSRVFRNDIIRNDRFHGIQSKLSGALEIRFSDTISLVINPNLDVDQMNWGGGNVQFIAMF